MSSIDLWSEKTDAYLETKLAFEDEALKSANQSAIDADIPPISVSPTQGAFLNILAKSVSAKRILEVGSLVGVSTIWLARALPEDGEMVVLEFGERNARLTSENLTRAGVRDRVDIRTGFAETSLNIMVNDGEAPFDFVFLDADKVNYPVYLERALSLSKRGTLIFCDNVIRKGGLVNPENTEPAIRGLKTMFDMIKAEPRLEATALQTVGSKGYDGFALLRVVS